MADDRLLVFANTLLDELVTELTTAGITVPAHRYIHSGEVAHDFTAEDCADALVVTFDGILEGQPNQVGNPLPGTTIKCAVPLVAQFTVALLRCVPALQEDGDAPTAEELEESASSLLLDAMELANAVVNIYLGSSCNLRSIGVLQPVGPQGAAGGHTMQVYGELI